MAWTSNLTPTGWLRRYLAVAGIALAIGLPDRPAGAAITFDNSSKVMILYGYSIDFRNDFRKQELTAVHPLLNILLPPLAADLTGELKTKVEYFTETSLGMRLTALTTNTAQGIQERTINEFLRGRYSHVIVANVAALGNEGFIKIQIAPISADGKAGPAEDLSAVTVGLSETNSNLDAIRRTLVTEFVRKFAAKQPPAVPTKQKFVHIKCILPHSPPTIDRLESSERDQVDLESMLALPLTNELIRFYRSDPMKKKGYESTVTEYTYMDFSKCSSIEVKSADYEVGGNVRVGRHRSGYDMVTVGIEVRRTASSGCSTIPPIREEIEPTIYRDKRHWVEWFSGELPTRFGKYWVQFESSC